MSKRVPCVHSNDSISPDREGLQVSHQQLHEQLLSGAAVGCQQLTSEATLLKHATQAAPCWGPARALLAPWALDQRFMQVITHACSAEGMFLLLHGSPCERWAFTVIHFLPSRNNFELKNHNHLMKFMKSQYLKLSKDGRRWHALACLSPAWSRWSLQSSRDPMSRDWCASHGWGSTRRLGSGSSGWGSSRQWVAAGDPCALQPFVKLFLSRTRVERVPRDHQWPHPGKGWSSWSKATSKLTKLALSGTKMCVLKALTSTVYRVSKGFKMSQISSARPFLVRTWEFSPRHLCRQPERSGFSNHTTFCALRHVQFISIRIGNVFVHIVAEIIRNLGFKMCSGEDPKV